MREYDEVEEREVQAEIAKIAGFIATAGGMNDRTIELIEENIETIRTRWHLRGVRVPKMAVLVFPKIGSIDIVNREIDIPGIQTIIVNLTRKYPYITREDIAFAVGRAFPEYRKFVDSANRNARWGKPALVV